MGKTLNLDSDEKEVLRDWLAETIDLAEHSKGDETADTLMSILSKLVSENGGEPGR